MVAQPTNNAMHTTAIEAMREAPAGRYPNSEDLCNTGILPVSSNGHSAWSRNEQAGKPARPVRLEARVTLAVPSRGCSSCTRCAGSAEFCRVCFHFVAISGLVSQLSLTSVSRRCPARFVSCFFSINNGKLGCFLPQCVNLTSNACAPREEARPSVWPARYMTTPFWFVSFACIFPSISVSPVLMPW